VAVKRPRALAYGLGRDSTAVLVGWHQRGIRPDHILFADVGSEKPETYAYLPIIRAWLKKVDFPDVTVVKYVPKIAPYTTIEGNCTQNCTLPGITFGRASCTVKWKIEPQNKHCRSLPDLKACWESGQTVIKAIGYEADETKRRNKVHGKTDPLYEYEYPLMDWGWTLDICKEQIIAAGLPVPPKSACFFCASMKPQEVRDLNPELRGRIIRMEIAAEPYNTKVHGLWRKPRKRDARPGSITEFILQEDLEFVHPDDLSDEMPLNPACSQAKTGYTMKPPHLATSLSETLAEHMLSKGDEQLLHEILIDFL